MMDAFALFLWEGGVKMSRWRSVQTLGRWSRSAWKPVALFAVILIMLFCYAEYNWSVPWTAGKVAGHRQGTAPVVLGLVDMPRLEELHPKYDQLLAIDAQILAREKQWWSYVELLTRQAKVDEINSPSLQEVVRGIDPQAAQLEAAAAVRESFEEQREQHLDNLRQQTTADLEKQRAQIEQALAREVTELQQQTQQRILERQVKLAILSLKQAEAEALLGEINDLQAEFEKQAQQVEEKYNARLKTKAEKAEAAALEQMLSYDEELMRQTVAQIHELAAQPIESEESGDIWQRILTVDTPSLNTKNVDGLERELLKAKAVWEQDMQTLLARRGKIVQDIDQDIEASVSLVAQRKGLTLVVDESQTHAEGIDLTNQVLDILQGEA
jgi:hypothetical protein